MNIEELEKRVNNRGSITYWKNDVMVGKKCTKCGVDKEIDKFNFKVKKQGTYRADCKECEKKREMEWQRNNVDKVRRNSKKWRENNVDKVRECGKKWRENNIDKVRGYGKKYRENNIDKEKERKREWQQNNPDKTRENNKRNNGKRKEKNLQKISNLLEQINPIFKQMNLPIYGYIYKFKNVKTGRVYIGQTIHPLKVRYHGDVIKNWIEERKNYENQKFKDELIEDDIEITEVLDVAFCKYHLDKLEVHYINKYDSYNNGYNNHAGCHNTDDGIEEFQQILKENGLEFINGKLVKIEID